MNKLFILIPVLATMILLPNAEARKKKKKYGPVPFAEKGIAGIELGDPDTSIKIIGQKRLEELYAKNEGKISEVGVGLNGLREGEVVILKPHKVDKKFAFSEIIIAQKVDLKEDAPVMAEPITVAAYTDHEVRIDTPKEQIQKTFGKATNVKKEAGQEVWTYKSKPGQDNSGILAANERDSYFHEFTFQDGKVKRIRYGFED